MTPDELRDKALGALQRPELTMGKIQLLLKRKWTTQKRMRIANMKGAPYGEPIADADLDGYVMVVFDAQEVMDWLEAVSATEEGSA